MEKKEKNKVKYVNSMIFKIQTLVVAAVLVTVVSLLFVSVSTFRSNVHHTIENYMTDEAISYGQLLERTKAVRPNLLNDAAYMGEMLGDVNVNETDSSYAYVVKADGTMVYHPTADKIGSPVENSVVKGLIADLEQGIELNTECVTYDYKGAEKYASYYVSNDGSFILVITADSDDLFSELNGMIVKVIIIGFFILAILTGFGIFVAYKMAKPIKMLSGVIDRVASLDFSVETNGGDKLVKRKDETGLMAKAIDNLYTQLSEIIGEIQKQVGVLKESNQKFGQTFADISESVNNVDIAVEGIAQGSTSQAQETTSANEQVIEIGVAIEANVDSVEVLNSSVEKMTELSKSAQDMLQELMNINDKTSKNIMVVSEQTEKTNESAEKIKEALVMIQDIAEQTNLLSLNASIEAARAGEAGKGFAVVAEQIRKLSEDSSASAHTIEDIVKELMVNSQDSVEKMSQVTKDSDVQYNKLVDTKKSFDGLQKEVDSVSYASKDIFNQTEKLGDLKGRVSMAVEQLAAIAEENAASTQETSASMQTLTSAIDECRLETEQLADLSVTLNDQTEKFKF